MAGSKWLFPLALLAMWVLPVRSGWSADLSVVSPLCERRVDPLGIDAPKPVLAWRLKASESSPRGASQSAFQVLVASTSELLGKDQADLWDSGKTKSREIAIAYAGAALRTSQRAYWKVRVWDQADAPSAWSAPATFTMGVLEPADWKASWVTAQEHAGPVDKTKNYGSTFLRREFQAKPGLSRAVVHVSGLGHYEMRLNGAKVGNDLLTPGWTTYNKTILYDTYDITSQLKPGANAVGVLLGAGMYQVEKPEQRYTKLTSAFGVPCAIAQLKLEYADGTSELIETDTNWTTHTGPITFSHVFGGEDYDARLVPAGWDAPGFSSTDWAPAQLVDSPGGVLKGASVANPPIRTFEVFKPVGTQEIRPGAIVYDMGQNASVMIRMTVKGPAGSSVRILPGETRGRTGVSQGAGGGPSFWTYTLAGNGSETYFPKFYYRGSRYEQVELSPAPNSTELPVIESIETVMLQADVTPVGTFECSNELFNRIYTLIRWAQRSNTFSVLTDCPHREKLGWLEQTYLNGPSLRYNFDLASFFTKTMNDMADAQTEIGMVPSIAPEFVKFGGDKDTSGFRNSPEWGSAIVMVALQQYQFHGDRELLAKHYDAMKRYVAYLGTKGQDHILDFGLGDWYDIGPKAPGNAQLTPRSLTATATYFADVQALAQIARVLGKPDDAKNFDSLASEIRVAFNKKYYNADKGNYSTNSQCANAMPLVLGLVEDANRQSVLDAIVADVKDRGLTAGDVGYRYLLRALADNGRSDVIYDLNNQSDRPGYGMILKKGATSLTEGWSGSGSQNHFMLGQINEWFFHDLAGIQPDPDAPGFEKIIIKPAVVGDLTWARASYESARGRISSAWKIDANTLTLDVTIPPGASATVWIPAASIEAVAESGHPLKSAPGISKAEVSGDRVKCEIASGEYRFVVQRAARR